jgi:hypothetical protein
MLPNILKTEIEINKIMASIENLSEDYYKYLLQQKNNPLVVESLDNKINKLTYVNSGKNITLKDKIKIINKIREKFNNINEGYDNTDFIKLLDELEKRNNNER